MNSINISFEQASEVEKEIKKLIKLGYSVPPIISALKKRFPYLFEIGQSNLIDYVDNVVSNYKPYGFIQKVKSSKIIVPTDSRNWFLYDSISKTKEAILESNIKLVCTFDYTANMLPCILDYKPFTSEDIIERTDGTYIFNTFYPSDWYSDYHYKLKEMPSKTILIPLYQKFFTHLLNSDEKSINYVLDWLANAIKGKNLCYLTTIGIPGAGKGTLGKIMCRLVGGSNYVQMPFKSITKQFNGQLENRKIIYFDEVKIVSRDQEDTLLFLVNDTIEVERKNQESKSVNNYASLYLSSNDYSALKIPSGDRRFSVVELTNTKLNETFSDSEIEQLLLPANIAELGEFLLSREVNTNIMSRPFVSQRTRLVQQASLSEWEDSLLGSIAFKEAGKKVSWTEVKRMIEREIDRPVKAGNKAVSELMARFPGFYSFKRENQPNNGGRLYMIQFYDLVKQPRHVLENATILSE